jgi:uncharacterized protein RhaS with RHS repeats
MNYNYFRDYDSVTGRYEQSDPIGLRGGLNSYVYARNQTPRFADPSGLVTWKGDFTGGSFTGPVGAGLYVYDLTSECIDGKQGRVKGIALGGAAGVGLDISLTSQTATFNDFESTPKPYVFAGTFTMIPGGHPKSPSDGHFKIPHLSA